MSMTKKVTKWDTPIGKDCINLETSLAEWLGERLVFMADNTNSFPMDFGDNGHSTWTNQIRKHGNALLAYSQRWEKDWDSDDITDAKAEAEVSREAKQAMMFVALHFENLWD